MMNSTVNDDDFSDNPFRSAGTGSGDDLYGNLGSSPPQQQQQQPQPQQQQQQQFQPQPDQFTAAPNNFAAPQPMMSGPMDNKGFAQQQQFQQQPQAQAQFSMAPRSMWGNMVMCLNMDSYRAYFDIDAEDIVMRMKSAMIDFYKPEFFRSSVVGAAKTDTLKGPDLYGPFWIVMTLIFFVAATSNMHAYLHRSEVKEFEYDINHLLHASSILMTFGFGIPIIMWVTTQCLGMQALQLVEWVCIYGYSLTPFMPAVMLCVIPFGIISWVALVVSTIMSGMLVVRNVTAPLLSSDVGQAKAPPLALAILGCHFIFFLFMKVSFYHRHGR